MHISSCKSERVKVTELVKKKVLGNMTFKSDSGKKKKQGYSVSEGKAAASELPSCGRVRLCHACCQSADATPRVEEKPREKMAP